MIFYKKIKINLHMFYTFYFLISIFIFKCAHNPNMYVRNNLEEHKDNENKEYPTDYIYFYNKKFDFYFTSDCFKNQEKINFGVDLIFIGTKIKSEEILKTTIIFENYARFQGTVELIQRKTGKKEFRPHKILMKGIIPKGTITLSFEWLLANSMEYLLKLKDDKDNSTSISYLSFKKICDQKFEYAPAKNFAEI